MINPSEEESFIVYAIAPALA